MMLSQKGRLVWLALIAWLLRSDVTAQNPSLLLMPNASSSVASIQVAQTTPVPTAKPTTIDMCIGKKIWVETLVDTSCKTIYCAPNVFRSFEDHMKCNDKIDDNRIKEISRRTIEYAASVATTYTATSPSIHANGSVSFALNEFLVEVGFLNKARSDLRHHSIVPDYGKSAASNYLGQKDIFKLSMISLDPGVTSYYIVLLKNLIPTTELLKFNDDKSAMVSRLEDMKLYSSPARTGKWVLNSQVVHINFNPLPSAMTEPIEVTFIHKELMKRKNHECIAFPGNLDNDFSSWTRAGCHRIYTDRFKTICRCELPGNLAVISQIDEESPPAAGFSRTFLSQVSMALSAFILLGLLCSIIYPVSKGYLHLVRVRIYFFHDIACFMVYFTFLIGVIVSENKTYTDGAAGCIHFFQTAVISWIFVEGVHNYHTFNPVYDPEVTSATFFYNTIGWGIPAAFSGACAGYPYDLNPLAEFSWMKVNGKGMAYFIVGPLFSALAVILSYVIIFYELRSYIGRKTDYAYRRAIEYFKRSGFLVVIAFLTWYSGIMARNNADKLSFSYLFLAMYGIQGAIFIYLHFLKNHEISEHRANLKSTRDGSLSARTEEDNISMQTSSRFSALDFRSEASIRDGVARRKSSVRPKSSKSGRSSKNSNEDGTSDDEATSRRSSSISSRSGSSESSGSSDEDGVDEQRSVQYDYSAYQIDDEHDEMGDSASMKSSERAASSEMASKDHSDEQEDQQEEGDNDVALKEQDENEDNADLMEEEEAEGQIMETDGHYDGSAVAEESLQGHPQEDGNQQKVVDDKSLDTEESGVNEIVPSMADGTTEGGNEIENEATGTGEENWFNGTGNQAFNNEEYNELGAESTA